MSIAKHGALVLWVALLVACGGSSATTPASATASEIGGSDAERIAQVTAIIAKQSAPPSAITAAHWREERLGDGTLGPSDFRTFGMLRVAPPDLERWQRMLVPAPKPPSYTSPTEACPWWVAQADFGALQFYQPGPLSGSSNGWIGIAPASGQIYIYSFTT